MGEVIVITSGKGGVGKTTSAANIAAGLSLLVRFAKGRCPLDQPQFFVPSKKLVAEI